MSKDHNYHNLPVRRFTDYGDNERIDAHAPTNRTNDPDHPELRRVAIEPPREQENARTPLFDWSWFPVQSNGDDYEINCDGGWPMTYALLFIGLIVMVSTVPSSYHYVDYNQFGLVRDNYGDVQLSPTYAQGRYFQPLTHSFVKFPATFVPVRFVSSVFDDNGLEFDLHISFYYRIPKVSAIQ